MKKSFPSAVHLQARLQTLSSIQDYDWPAKVGDEPFASGAQCDLYDGTWQGRPGKALALKYPRAGPPRQRKIYISALCSEFFYHQYVTQIILLFE